MSTPVEIVGVGKVEDRLKSMEKVLRKTQDPLLKEHIRHLRRVWGAKNQLPKAA